MDLEKNTCKLCCETPKNGCEIIDETTMEMLDILKIIINSEIINDAVICKDCLEAVRRSFNFKAVCIDTEELILTFADGKNETRIDIKDMYTDSMDAATIIDDKVGICRLCLKQSEIGSFMSMDAFISDTEHGHILSTFLHEMDRNRVKDPLVCKLCEENVQYYVKFTLNCLGTQENIIKNELNDHPEIYHKSLKTEAENEFDIKYEELNLNEDFYKIPPEAFTEQLDGYFYNKNSKIKLEINKESNKFECALCSYKSKQKTSMRSHMLVHKDELKAKRFKCVTCPYETDCKPYMRQHILMHKDASQLEMLQCAKCPFKSKYKYSIRQHMLCHKDASEIRMYKCPLCTYKAKRSHSVVNHLVIHKDLSEVEMHKCTLCPHKTRHKRHLKRHMLTHSKVVRKVRTFRCSMCSFETPYKYNLKNHKLTHKATE